MRLAEGRPDFNAHPRQSGVNVNCTLAAALMTVEMLPYMLVACSLQSKARLLMHSVHIPACHHLLSAAQIPLIWAVTSRQLQVIH